MSDAAVTPPLRLQIDSAKHISIKAAHTRIETFLAEFQQRSTPLSGGDATVPAQLNKLRDALREANEKSRT